MDPSQQVAQSIIGGNDGSTPNDGNVARGLFDFTGLGSRVIAAPNVSPQDASLGVPPISAGADHDAGIARYITSRAPLASPFQTMSLFGATPLEAARDGFPAGRTLDAEETIRARGSSNAMPQQARPTSRVGHHNNGGAAGGKHGYGQTAPNAAGSGPPDADVESASEGKGLTRVQQQPMNSDFARAMIGIIDATQGKLENGSAGQAAFANGSTSETNPDGSHLVKEGTVFSVTPDGRGFATTGSAQNGTMVLVKPDGSVTLLRGPL
jgi:hypothetical protein